MTEIITVSDLTTYQYCPRKLYLLRVLKVKPALKKEVLFGRIRHEILDLINKEEKRIISSITRLDKVFVEETLRKYYSRIITQTLLREKAEIRGFNLRITDVFNNLWPSIKLMMLERRNEIYDFMLRTGFLGEELYNKIIPKTESEKKITSEKLGLKGIIDLIKYYPNEIVPVEYKTGSIPINGVWPSHKIQIASYIMLLMDYYNKHEYNNFREYGEGREGEEGEESKERGEGENGKEGSDQQYQQHPQFQHQLRNYQQHNPQQGNSKIMIKQGIIKYLDFEKMNDNVNDNGSGRFIEKRITLNPFLELKIHSLINSVRLLLEEKRIPRICKNRNKCKSCSLRKYCYELS